MIEVTEKEKNNEDQVAKIVERQWQVRMVSQHPMSRADYLAINKSFEAKGIIEIRCRRKPAEDKEQKYADFFIAKNKIESLQTLSDELQIPSMLIVGWCDDDLNIESLEYIWVSEGLNDTVFHADIDKISIGKDWSENRKGQSYSEEMAHFNWDRFTEIPMT